MSPITLQTHVHKTNGIVGTDNATLNVRPTFINTLFPIHHLQHQSFAHIYICKHSQIIKLLRKYICYHGPEYRCHGGIEKLYNKDQSFDLIKRSIL